MPPPAHADEAKTGRSAPTSTQLAVTGMTCQNCLRHVTEALRGVPGVAQAEVDLKAGTARVRWAENRHANPAALVDAVKQAGFEAKLPPTTSHYQVGGMTCQNCARQVAEAIRSVPGVKSVEVQLEAGRAKVQWMPGVAPEPQRVLDAVKGAGYEAKPASGRAAATPASSWSPFAGWKLNVVLGGFVTISLLLGEWILGLGLRPWFQWLAFALALPVQIICGARFYVGAWRQLRVGSSNMDTLVALGSTTAFSYSTYALLAGGHTHLYFMESAAIITLISVGHWVESIATERAAGALRLLLDLAPAKARRLDAQDRETEVALTELEPGDRVLLKPGDRVPTDGEVVSGNSAVDESMLTGESLPTDKTTGATVYAGTVNQNGRLTMRVTATGESTALAHIIAVVQRAQSSRAQIQKLGDRVSSVFVPVVVLVAVATALAWGLSPLEARQVHEALAPFLWPAHVPDSPLAAALILASGVLIVACPCAMGLATPAAIMAGTNAAARRGILVRDALALEKTGQLTMVLFDKTGTLSQGKVAVAAVEDYRKPEDRTPSLQDLAATTARPSSHPLSQAMAKLSERTLPTSDWREERGAGTEAKLVSPKDQAQGEALLLGSLNWLRQAGVDLAPANSFAEHWSSTGATLVGLASNGSLVGMLALRDAIKPYAAAVVAQLRQQGKAVGLVTGDHRLTALAVARLVGIAEADVFAEVRPEKKAEIIQQLQKQGHRVAFIGDGINDAPALEQADLGIAVSQASDVAREAADIILLKSDIQAIPEALNLAHATLRTIKQNLFWAFFYNAAAVPLAALGFLSPVLCAAAMGLSDLLVIGNALRLQRWQNH